MKHQYIEAPNKVKIKNDISVFLAGGISNCEDWQAYTAEILKDLDGLTVVNPRRNNWKMDKNEVKESTKQIAWEYEYLRKVTDVIFWFTDDTLQPISLYELGATLERNAFQWQGEETGQRIFLGSDPGYKRVLDLKVQAKLKGYHWPIRNNLDDLLEDFVKYYKKVKSGGASET